MASPQVYMSIPSVNVHGYGCHQEFTDSSEMYVAIP